MLGDDTIVKIPHGYHPIAVPPAWRMYCLAVLAGDERTWALRHDPDHRWPPGPAPA